MTASGWCMSGHHAGGTYKWSKPCDRPNCTCACHAQKRDNGPKSGIHRGRAKRRRAA